MFSTASRPTHAVGEIHSSEDSLLRAIIDATPTALLMVDASRLIYMVNAEFEHLLGYSHTEILGQPLEVIIPERFRSSHSDHHAAFLDQPKPRPMGRRRDLIALLKDGSEIPVEIGLSPIQTTQGTMVLAAIVDLSARKILEESLREKTEHLRLEIEQRNRAEAEIERSRSNSRYLFEHNPLPMYVSDETTLNFLQVNAAALEMYGYTREEFLSMKVTDIRPPDEVDKLKTFMAGKFSTDFHKSTNWCHRNKSGATFQVDVFVRTMVYQGHHARLVVIVDVTERNSAELKLRQSQKMEAIGQLTGGVAHDFNNLLTIVLTNLEMIGELSRQDPTISSMVSEAIDSVSRGASLTQRLLAYSRQQPLEPHVIDIRESIHGMTNLLRRSLGETIHIHQVLPDELGKACIDPHQLENALLNLAVNARDAMPHGGKLTIEAGDITLNSTFTELNPEFTPGDYVVITISDTGTGMSREVMEHVLEPFYTTKPVGQGTGLGLSMVYGFVKQSGGHLKLYSEPGLGTTIKLYLARAGAPITASAQIQITPSPLHAPSPNTNGEVILVVEDDPIIRKLVTRLLPMLGYRVINAEDGPSALRAIAQAPRVHLLFTDVVLPNGMTGVALAEQARQRHPDLKVLFMSGYTRNALVNSGVHDDTVHLLTKPFSRDDLAAAIHKVLHDNTNREALQQPES